MEDILCCYQCGLGFKQVGFLSQEKRLDAHEQIQHRIKCGECEDFFISQSHLKYHIETQHDARCAGCCTFCNKKCSIQYAMRTEVANDKVMRDVIDEKLEAVESAMSDLEKCVKEKTQKHMTALEEITRQVDAGFDSPETIDWCRIIYIPVPRMLEKKNVSTKVK